MKSPLFKKGLKPSKRSIAGRLLSVGQSVSLPKQRVYDAAGVLLPQLARLVKLGVIRVRQAGEKGSCQITRQK